jgi:uncharacterized protein (TIGR03437 family)
VNAVVPDDVPASGVAKAKLTVGTTSSSEWGVPFAAAAPGIFTLDGSGTGPAAVLNQDNSVNTPANPAAHGSVIQIFATGIPNADQPIKVAIGGFDAPIQYQGPAPGLISGVQQINVIVPSQAPPIGALSLVIRINGLISTTAATIAVR